GEVLLERLRVAIERDENEAAIRRHVRRRGEPELAALEARRIAGGPGHAVQAAVAVVAPAVIEAGVAPGVALALAAHHGTPMAANVEEDVQGPGAVAADDHRPSADGARHEVARLAYLALVAGV